jgi:hypothetical protein
VLYVCVVGGVGGVGEGRGGVNLLQGGCEEDRAWARPRGGGWGASRSAGWAGWGCVHH